MHGHGDGDDDLPTEELVRAGLSLCAGVLDDNLGGRAVRSASDQQDSGSERTHQPTRPKHSTTRTSWPPGSMRIASLGLRHDRTGRSRNASASSYASPAGNSSRLRSACAVVVQLSRKTRSSASIGFVD